MADFFGAIAAGEIGTGRVPLIFPTPTPKNGVIFPLERTEHKTPLDIPKKISSRAELDFEIEKLKTKYAPFRRHLAPAPREHRERFFLSDFMKRSETAEDLRDFTRVLRGEGEWERVKVPDFDGPLGNACVYYRTSFSMAIPDKDKAVFLRFDGVDYIAEVHLNGSFLGRHEGFFGALEFEATPYLHEGENILVVTVRNDYVYGGNQGPTADPCRLEGDKMYAATGFGFDDAERGWHHCPPGMGICQAVSVEIRSRVFLSDLFVRPMLGSGEIEIFAEVCNCDYTPLTDITLTYAVYGRNFEKTVLAPYAYTPITFTNEERGDIVSISMLSDKDRSKTPLTFHKGENLVKLRFPMEAPRLWEPDLPYLYEAQVTLSVGGAEVDAKVTSFGMREFTEDTVNAPKGMFYLNGRPLRLRGANTMGFEQQDVLRGDMDALLYDMLMAKACHMNFLRLTQRPVQKEIYELCDEIGLMLQTDLPLFTVMRRTKFAEGVRQAEEMERLIRPHASSILISYMNEPMVNGNNRPHRHFVRYEMEAFFAACDTAVRLLNPDRIIKHIDGDYDPPDSTLPDNHVYCTWYNGHGIDLGRLHRGHWLGVKEGWYYGCGEFGAEGLDPVSLMRRRYPASWLPQTAEEEKAWSPADIKDAQSGNMHFFYYDTQDSLESWVSESRKYQAFATKIQTEAFRRDPRMITFAIHLFIDAWPSGWMKTIVDCEREPKPAYFAYRDALTPLMVSIRNDRRTVFAGEKVAAELFVCNDTEAVSNGHRLICELLNEGGEAEYRGAFEAKFGGNSSFMQGDVTFTAPERTKRGTYTLRVSLIDGQGNLLHYNEEPIEVFPQEAEAKPTATELSGEEFLAEKETYLALAESGRTVIVNGLPNGIHDIGGTAVKVKPCGMRALHFVSRKTGHPLAEGFSPYDFRLWYEREADCITPILRRTFTGEGLLPILTSGNSLTASAWGQKLYPALACAELPYGKGKLILNEVELKSHLENPVARIFRNRLLRY